MQPPKLLCDLELVYQWILNFGGGVGAIRVIKTCGIEI